MSKGVVIVAGGKGLRMGTDIPKQFLLLNGKPILMHTIEAFYNYDHTINIVLVLPESQFVYWAELKKKHNFKTPHSVVSGGETRFHSVKNGIKFFSDDVSLIAVHDGVRPLVSKEIIARTFNEAKLHGGAYPVIPVVETLRKRDKKGGKNKQVDREDYFLGQTPQTFQTSILRPLYNRRYSKSFTDDVSIVEKAKACNPITIEGSRENIKITTSEDLILAEAILKCRN